MTTESKAGKAQSASELADWRLIDEHVQRQGLPREVTDALGRIRDPEARAKFDKEEEAGRKQEEEQRRAAAAKEKERQEKGKRAAG